VNWTADHATAFHRDGYVFIERFLSDSELDEVQSNVDRFIRDLLPGLPREHAFYENKDATSSLKQIQRLGEHDDYFGRLISEGSFREVAELLLAGPVEPKNLQYFNKPAGIGQPTPPHQDGYYFMLEPCEAVTIWFALDHVDAENGCVRYVPGSHLCGMRPHGRTQTLGFSQGITGYTDEDTTAEVAIPAHPGDLLVHQAMTIHRADGNRSRTRSRRALGFVYYSQQARPDEAAHRAYQQKLKQEMVHAGQI
jgi:phytanoyl-CoA hydroxylase